MARMNLRQAADRTSRSITTLRRYIRSGRLRAEKRDGRYGPEYFVSEADLARAGLHALADDEHHGDGPEASRALARTATRMPPAALEAVPLSLYQELQMKHEQLLVQYGMVRTAGMKILELQAELETIRDDRQRQSGDAGRLTRRLREAELELEGKRLEIAALKEKVRGLEMLTRNSVTSENIERQFSRVMSQARRVQSISGEAGPAGIERAEWPARRRSDDPDH